MANNNATATPPQMASLSANAATSVEGHWQQYWEGQRKINGLLFETDKNLITAILELKKIVVNAVNIPPGVDLDALYTAIYKAKDYAEKVPAVDPPGCISPDGGPYTGGGTGNGQS